MNVLYADPPCPGNGFTLVSNRQDEAPMKRSYGRGVAQESVAQSSFDHGSSVVFDAEMTKLRILREVLQHREPHPHPDRDPMLLPWIDPTVDSSAGVRG